MTTPDLARQIAALALLEEPVRRVLYDYIAGRPAPVGRDEAARGARVSRALAAFHLDKLAAAGLLEVSYQRLSLRRGPGAGRPAKLYRRAGRQLDVSVPARRYDLAARLLAAGVAGTGGGAVEAVARAARRLGAGLGRAARRAAGPRAGRGRLLDCAAAVLRDHGFEPERSADVVRLRNCPFDALAREFRPLVCGMNRSLLDGMVRGLGARGMKAELRPEPGRCCVVLRPAGPGPRGSKPAPQRQLRRSRD